MRRCTEKEISLLRAQKRYRLSMCFEDLPIFVLGLQAEDVANLRATRYSDKIAVPELYFREKPVLLELVLSENRTACTNVFLPMPNGNNPYMLSVPCDLRNGEFSAYFEERVFTIREGMSVRLPMAYVRINPPASTKQTVLDHKL